MLSSERTGNTLPNKGSRCGQIAEIEINPSAVTARTPIGCSPHSELNQVDVTCRSWQIAFCYVHERDVVALGTSPCAHRSGRPLNLRDSLFHSLAGVTCAGQQDVVFASGRCDRCALAGPPSSHKINPFWPDAWHGNRRSGSSSSPLSNRPR